MHGSYHSMLGVSRFYRKHEFIVSVSLFLHMGPGIFSGEVVNITNRVPLILTIYYTGDS